MIPSGLTSTSSKGIGASRISAASFAKGCDDKPWYDFVQSTCLLPSSRMSGSSARPVVMSCMGDTSSIGSGFDAGFAAAGGAAFAAL